MTDKANKTKRLFIDTAHSLFLENGYENVSVASICEKAGKAKGLFFYHFEKKDNIVKLLLEEQLIVMVNELKAVLDNMKVTELQKMDFLMNLLVSKEQTGPEALYYFRETGIPLWIDLYTQSLRDKYVFPIILSLVRDGIKNNIFKPSSDDSVEIIYLGISQFIHRNHSKLEKPEGYRKSVDSIARTLETALGSPEGSINIK